MSNTYQSRSEVSYGPCPPEKFAGRFEEKNRLLEILEKAKIRGQVVMISGADGSGKSSFLNWAEYETQNTLKSPTIRKPFLETTGTIFITFSGLLTDLKGHQKFGWFRQIVNDPETRNYIDTALGLLGTLSSLAGVMGGIVEFGVAGARKALPQQSVELCQLVFSFLKVLRSLSSEMIKNDQFLVIFLDDVQWADKADLALLRDLFRNVPPGIVFIFTFSAKPGKKEEYIEFQRELTLLGHAEIRLGALDPEGVKDFAVRNYNFSVDDSTARFLSKSIGDPLCLIACFNLLQRRNLPPTLVNVKNVLPDAVDPAWCVYSGLEEKWKERVNSLCILHPPLLLSSIACVLGIKTSKMVQLQHELDQSVVFRRLEKEFYDFAHPSLREYRRKELPSDVAAQLHSQAATCFETLKGQFIEFGCEESIYELSLAEHLFFGKKYEKALELNLQLSEWLYSRFDYSSALQLAERAITCAKKIGDDLMLADAFHQKGKILESVFKFPKSLDAFNRSLQIKQRIGDRAGEAETLHYMGRVYQLTGEFEKALKYYNRSLQIEREIGDRAGETKTLHMIGLAYQSREELEKALEYYNRSLQIEWEEEDRTNEAKTIHQIGRTYELAEEFEKALEYYNRSLQIEREIGDRAGEAQTLHQIGMVYELAEEFEKALEYYNRSLQIEREIGDRTNEAKTLHMIGVAYQSLEKLEKALEYYNRSLQIEREIGDRAGEAKTLYNIGKVYESKNCVEEALRHYDLSFKINQEIGNKSEVEKIMNKIRTLKEKNI